MRAPLAGRGAVGVSRPQHVLPAFGRSLVVRRAMFPFAFSAVYLVTTGVIAARRPLWNDEVYTYDFARAHGVSGVWHALETGADQAPPLSYLLTRVSVDAFGHGRLAIRLPEILAYLVFCLYTYLFVARRTNELHGVIAMVVPTLTAAGYYASEARAYALVLAFAAVALVCWQASAEGRHRRAAVVGLALALALATSAHYYAVLIVVPLALGEVARSLARRAVDPPVWIAFGFSFLPLAAFIQLIRAAHNYAVDFWGRPGWTDPPRFFSFLFDTRSTVNGIELGQIGRPTVWWLVFFAVGVLTLALLVLAAAARRHLTAAVGYRLLAAIAALTLLGAVAVAVHDVPISPRGVIVVGLALLALAGYLVRRISSGPPLLPAPPPHEVVALGAFLLLPLAAVILAETVTHAYSDRYALPAVIGLAVLPLALHRLEGRRPFVSAAVLAGLTAAFAASAVVHTRHASELLRAQAATMSFLERAGSAREPIVVDNDHLYLELSFAAPASLADRLVYVAAPRWDSTQRGLLKLGPIAHLRVYDRSHVDALPRRFLVFTSRRRTDWADTRYWTIMRTLQAEGLSIVYEAAHGQRALFQVSPGPAASR
jgi:4-amino-4-deoxy-L-arabinose transferase-like glycosyltransferase